MALDVKKIIAGSLLELIEDTPIEKITVSQIVMKAGVGRQTFYNHFSNKNELIYWIFCRTLAGEKQLMDQEGLYSYLTKLYKEAKKYRHFLQEACRQEGPGSLAEAICRQTYRYYRNYIINKHGESVINDELEYVLQFNAYGASHQYVAWAESGMEGAAVDQAANAILSMPEMMKQYIYIGKDFEQQRIHKDHVA